MKRFKKFGAIIFLSAYLFIGFGLTVPFKSLAAAAPQFVPQIGIPGSDFQQGAGTTIGSEGTNAVTGEAVMRSDLLARYIAAFYNWGFGIVGVIAVLMLMAAGVIWLTSGGDSGKIGNAKKMIEGALMGTGLLVGSWFLLNTINPNLTNLPALEMVVISNISESFLTNAEKISYVCMSDSLTCANTNPPSLNINLETCYQKFGQTPNNCTGTENPNRWCCGINANTQAKANLFCKDKSDGTACKINETSKEGTGYCFNNECKQCTYYGLSCTNSYECLSGSLMICGNGDAPNVDFPSNCNAGFCAGISAKENDSCGANNEGKCLAATLYTCPGNTQAVGGGTNCDSGLKCCK